MSDKSDATVSVIAASTIISGLSIVICTPIMAALAIAVGTATGLAGAASSNSCKNYYGYNGLSFDFSWQWLGVFFGLSLIIFGIPLVGASSICAPICINGGLMIGIIMMLVGIATLIIAFTYQSKDEREQIEAHNKNERLKYKYSHSTCEYIYFFACTPKKSILQLEDFPSVYISDDDGKTWFFAENLINNNEVKYDNHN